MKVFRDVAMKDVSGVSFMYIREYYFVLLGRASCAAALYYFLLSHLFFMVMIEINSLKSVGGVDGTRTRDPRRDRPVF